ncbi:hypothetical protein K7432_017353 [Basidiobolus ranarum]|uniref:WH2 domain-containing protein n=1 Tax=Basidiobolus ranarum TaxID=34480 RepID=A0ABR2WDH9_9FUNG
MGAGIPPPPPMGSGVQTPSKLPPPTDDRNGLLASIRGAGGIGALKHVDRSETASPKLPSPVEDSAGGGDLAMALANALSARNKVLAHSDSENEDDDDDWDEDD